MSYIRMTDEAYWRVPERLQIMQDLRRTRGRSKQFVLGSPYDDNAASGIISEFPAIYPLTRHAHDCHALMLVIRGSLFVDSKVLYPGDMMSAEPFEFYGPEVTGPDGCTVVELFGALTGLVRGIFEMTDGEIVVVDALAEVPSFDPASVAGMGGLQGLMARAVAAGESAEIY